MRFSILRFRKESNGESFTNLEFHVMEPNKLEADWTATFELAFIFDACHDQMRPDLASIRSSLKTEIITFSVSKKFIVF